MNEVTGNLPTDYTLHNVPGARVLKFFMENYAKFGDWMKSTLRSVGKSGYTVVFTGHSLGGALALHAATDVYLSGDRSADKISLYTFGQPRVGNKEFDMALNKKVKDAYRVVHWADLVPHVPPCVPQPLVGKSSCLSSGFDFTIYPFHTMDEVFYTADESSYQVCTHNEDKNCSNQFWIGNVDNHLTYLGVNVGGASTMHLEEESE